MTKVQKNYTITKRKDVLKHENKNFFCIYQNIKSLKNEIISLNQLVYFIKKGQIDLPGLKYNLSDQINKVRKATTPEEKTEYKKDLPAILTSCIVPNGKSKEAKNIKELTGFIQIDFDHLPAEQIHSIKELLTKDIYSKVVFISPSGSGLKIIVQIDKNKDFLKLFNGLKKYYLEKYKLELDTACKNKNRLMFLSYDEDIFLNDNSVIFSNEYETPAEQNTHPELIKRTKKSVFNNNNNNDFDNFCKKHLDNKLNEIENALTTAKKGTRHETLLKESKLLGGYISGGWLSFSDGESFLNSLVNSIFSKNESDIEFKAVKDGLNYGKNEPITKEQKFAERAEYLSTHPNKELKKSFTPVQLKEVKNTLKIEYQQVIKVKNKVSEAAAQIKKEIERDKRLFIFAPTGTGKTYAFLKNILPAFLSENKKVLFCVPLRALADGIGKEYNINVIKGGCDENDIKTAIVDGVGIATYDKAINLVDYFDYIIIDEAHNFLSSFNFRNKTIKNLWQKIKNKNITFISATPPLNLFKHLNFKTLKIEVENFNAENVEIRKGFLNSYNTTVTHLKNTHAETILLKLNNLEDLQNIKEFIINNKIAEKKEVLILDSNIEAREEDYKEYLYLIKNQEFNKYIKIILVTSFLNDGININQKFDEVVIIQNQYNPDPNETRQFIARFRNQKTNFVEYVKDTQIKNFNLTPEKHFKKLRLEVISEIEKISSGFDLSEHYYGLDVVKTSKFIDFYNNEPNINDISILYDVYKNFVNSLSTAEYINFLENNYNIKYNADNFNFFEKLTEIKEDKEAKEAKRINFDKILFFNYSKNFVELVKFFLKYSKDIILKNTIKELLNISYYPGEDLKINVEDLRFLKANFDQVETLIKKHIELTELNTDEDLKKCVIFTKDKEGNVRKTSNLKYKDIIRKLQISILMMTQKFELNFVFDGVSAFNLQKINNLIKTVKNFHLNTDFSFIDLMDILSNEYSKLMYSNLYNKNHDGMKILKQLFEIEKRKENKQFIYKIVGIKDQQKELKKLISECSKKLYS